MKWKISPHKWWWWQNATEFEGWTVRCLFNLFVILSVQNGKVFCDQVIGKLYLCPWESIAHNVYVFWMALKLISIDVNNAWIFHFRSTATLRPSLSKYIEFLPNSSHFAHIINNFSKSIRVYVSMFLLFYFNWENCFYRLRLIEILNLYSSLFVLFFILVQKVNVCVWVCNKNTISSSFWSFKIFFFIFCYINNVSTHLPFARNEWTLL